MNDDHITAYIHGQISSAAFSARVGAISLAIIEKMIAAYKLFKKSEHASERAFGTRAVQRLMVLLDDLRA